MGFDRVIEGVTGMGAWGIFFALTLLILSGVFSLVVIRRTSSGSSGNDINWSKIGMTLLSTLLFLCSGAWSGWALFLEYYESNILLAWVLAGGLVVAGGVTSVVLQSFASRAIRESGASRVATVFFIIIITGFWLTISPVFNAMTICRNAAVQAEISLRYQALNSISKPIVEQYNLFRSKAVPLLVDIQKFLDKSIKEQEQIGGCGPICNEYKTTFYGLEPSVARLYEEYSPDDQDTNLAERVMDLQQEIFNLLAGSDWSAEEIRAHFFRLASKWNRLIFRAKHTDDPEKTLERAIAQLNELSLFLAVYAEKESDHESIRYKAVKAAMASLQPKLNDLQMLLQSRDITLVISREESNVFSANSDSDLSQIASIKITPLLLWKHKDLFWNSIALAFFIDFLALAMVLMPMISTMLRSRPVQRAMESVRRERVKVRRLQADLGALQPKIISFDEKEKGLLGQCEKQLTGLDKQRGRVILNECKKLNGQLAVNQKKHRQTLERRNKLLTSLQADMNAELQRVTSAEEEEEIRGKYAIYTKNTKEKFSESLILLAEENRALNERKEQVLSGIEERFSKKQQNIQEQYSREHKALLRRKEATVEHKIQLKAKLSKAEAALRVAEEHLTTLQGNTTTPFDNYSLHRSMIR